MFDRARQVYADRVSEMLSVLGSSMPYDQAHAEFERLASDFDPDDPASVAAGALLPALPRVLTLKVRSEAQANAMTVGVDLCLQRAETGKLPDALPAGSPKDPFSGEDFEYERTDDGFILRCRGKDLDKDTAWEYAFAVK
jgi:hypothetical protein